MEFIYFIGYRGEPWFCYPDNVGWVWAIVNFLLYGLTLHSQIHLGKNIINEICGDSSPNFRVGIYSYGITIILGIIFSFANAEMLEYIFYGFIAVQIVQIVINFWLIKHVGKALIVSLLFITLSIAIIVSSIYFIGILILLAFISFILEATAEALKHTTVTEEIHHYH